MCIALGLDNDFESTHTKPLFSWNLLSNGSAGTGTSHIATQVSGELKPRQVLTRKGEQL